MYNKIQFKIIALITLVTAFFVLGLLSLNKSETKNISMLLKDRVSEKDTIIRKIIDLKSKTLISYVYDYSYWDEMLAFVKTKDEKWAYENLITPMPTFNINAIWIYDTDFNLIYNTNDFSERTFKELPLSKEDFKSIISKNPFAHFYINVSAGLMEISIAPLQPGYDTKRVTPASGYYIGGRLWTDAYLKDIASLTSSRIFLINNFKDTTNNINTEKFEFINDVYMLDWNGSVLLKLRAVTESPVIENFFKYSLYQFFGITLFIILIIVLISMYLFKIVNRPLRYITQSLGSGNTKPIEHLFNKKDEFGEISRLISDNFKYKESLLEEISMRKKAEEDLINAKEKVEEISKLKSNLLANLSHEFRTPLCGIIGISELLKDEINDSEQGRLLNDITISGRRLHDTLNSILLLAQFESSQISISKETIDISDEIESYIGKFKYKSDDKNLELEFINSDRNILVETDRELLKQIFYNVFDNAVKFTDKGKITIKLYTKIVNDKLYSALDIIDTGIGIPDKFINLIFDEFKQVSEGYGRKFEGTGLGLTLTKKVLDLINGTISCTSKIGVGSTFSILIPAIKPVEIHDEMKWTLRKTIQEKPDLQNILLVEDNLSNQFVFQRFLTGVVNVEFANDGYNALELISKHKYKMVFMDINLGTGMDGIETMKEIKKNQDYKDVPFIALTGYAMEQDRDYFLSNGFDYFVVKPFGKSDLISIVNLILKNLTE
jgi:signal transduction histidine kinase